MGLLQGKCYLLEYLMESVQKQKKFSEMHAKDSTRLRILDNGGSSLNVSKLKLANKLKL